MVEGIPASDAEWLLGYLGRLRREQIVDAVLASGGTAEEAEQFARALVERIDLMRASVSGSTLAGVRAPP